MDEIKDILKTYSDKLKHSFFGPFIVSWSVVNWKFIFFLIVSDVEASVRIDTALGFVNIYTLLLIPAGIALFHIYAMPFITYHFNKPKKHVIGWQDENEDRRINTLLDYQIENAKKEYEVEQARKGDLTRKEFEETIDELNSELQKRADYIQEIENKNSKLNGEKVSLGKKTLKLNERINEQSNLLDSGFSYKELLHIRDAEINKKPFQLADDYLKLAEKYYLFKQLRKREDYHDIAKFLKNLKPNEFVNKSFFYKLKKGIQEFLLRDVISESVSDSKESTLYLTYTGKVLTLFVKVYNEENMT